MVCLRRLCSLVQPSTAAQTSSWRLKRGLAQSYNEKGSLTTSTFWRNGVLLAIVDAAICFFFTYYSINTHGIESATDVYSVGKGAFIALLGTVTLEVCPGPNRMMMTMRHTLRSTGGRQARGVRDEACWQRLHAAMHSSPVLLGLASEV